MTIKKGTRVKTKGAWWIVKETQSASKWLHVESEDGFETIVDIDAVDLYR